MPTSTELANALAEIARNTVPTFEYIGTKSGWTVPPGREDPIYEYTYETPVFRVSLSVEPNNKL